MFSFIQNLSMNVPWSNLLSDDTRILVDGLTITVQVRQRANPTHISASLFHSMCESFSTMSMAEDCLNEDKLNEELDEAEAAREGGKDYPGEDLGGGATVIGVEVLAQAIDSIISRFVLQVIFNTRGLGVLFLLLLARIIFSKEGNYVIQWSPLSTSPSGNQETDVLNGLTY